MNNATYVTAKQVQQEYAISSGALRKWDREGKINTIRSPGGKRLYKWQDIQGLFGKGGSVERRRVCYARVSSEHQKEDLDRQIQDLRSSYPNHEILSDIGSGLNWNRKSFNKILDEAFQGKISEIVISHRDRLCRFGYELVERIFKKLNVKIVVDPENALENDDTKEFSDDLLSIVTVFVARNNGKRSADNRRKRKRDASEKEKNKKIHHDPGEEHEEDSLVSD